MAVYEALLLNTVVPQIQAAQAGDSYVMVVNATTPALRITQTGTGDSILVEDAANPDSSPFVVTAAGDVGAGISSPAAKLDVRSDSVDSIFWGKVDASVRGVASFTGSSVLIGSGTVSPVQFVINSVEKARLDTSGNLGLGVTPSAWSTFKAIDLFSTLGACLASTSGSMQLGMNFYYDGLSYRYKDTGYATRYEQLGGGAGDSSHAWFNAPSGTAGNAISFTQAMTLDASGNLVVGTTGSAQGRVHAHATTNAQFVATDATLGTTYGGVFRGYGVAGQGGNAELGVLDNGSYTKAIKILDNATGIQFFTGVTNAGSTERARITSGGEFLVGATSTATSSDSGFKVLTPAADHWDPAVVTPVNNSSYSCWDIYSTGAGAYQFYVTTTGVINATNTTISAISDVRLKENIQDLDVGLDKIMALKPRKFDWKAGKGKDIKGDRGWIAQEFEQVFPDMVDEWKDPAPEGEEPYKSVRADLIPVLVKAIQEQQAMINELKAEVAALKGA